MATNVRRWLRSWTWWAWVASMLLLGVAAACKDTTVPNIVNPPDTAQDSSKGDDQG